MKSKTDKPLMLRLLIGAIKTCGVCVSAYFLMIVINYISENHLADSKNKTKSSKFSKVKVSSPKIPHNKNAFKATDKNAKKAKSLEMFNTRNEIVKKIKEQNSADRQ